MTIRDMTAADLERVREINEANVPEVSSVDRERLRFIVDESVIALVVTDTPGASDAESDSDAIVGFCLVLAPGSTYDSLNYRWFMEHHDDAHYLDRVAFVEAARGKGLGSALYAEVDRRLAERGVALTLEVNIDPPNEPSLAFHRKHGFVEVGRQTSKGLEVSMMRKSYVESDPA